MIPSGISVARFPDGARCLVAPAGRATLDAVVLAHPTGWPVVVVWVESDGAGLRIARVAPALTLVCRTVLRFLSRISPYRSWSNGRLCTFIDFAVGRGAGSGRAARNREVAVRSDLGRYALARIVERPTGHERAPVTRRPLWGGCVSPRVGLDEHGREYCFACQSYWCADAAAVDRSRRAKERR